MHWPPAPAARPGLARRHLNQLIVPPRRAQPAHLLTTLQKLVGGGAAPRDPADSWLHDIAAQASLVGGALYVRAGRVVTQAEIGDVVRRVHANGHRDAATRFSGAQTWAALAGAYYGLGRHHVDQVVATCVLCREQPDERGAAQKPGEAAGEKARMDARRKERGRAVPKDRAAAAEKAREDAPQNTRELAAQMDPAAKAHRARADPPPKARAPAAQKARPAAPPAKPKSRKARKLAVLAGRDEKLAKHTEAERRQRILQEQTAVKIADVERLVQQMRLDKEKHIDHREARLACKEKELVAKAARLAKEKQQAQRAEEQRRAQQRQLEIERAIFEREERLARKEMDLEKRAAELAEEQRRTNDTFRANEQRLEIQLDKVDGERAEAERNIKQDPERHAEKDNHRFEVPQENTTRLQDIEASLERVLGVKLELEQRRRELEVEMRALDDDIEVLDAEADRLLGERAKLDSAEV